MKNKVYTANQYIGDVLSGRVVTCKWVQLAVKRHVNDLKRQNTPDFPYYFDDQTARRVIDFKQQLMHTKGRWAGNLLKLEPWQQFKDWVLFGWKRAGGLRRFRKAYITVARKNGKTTDGAATSNYCFVADRPRENGAECYCAATKREQARISWEEAKRQVQFQKTLRKRVKVFSNSLVIPGTAAKSVPLGKDSKTEDGLNPHFVLIDEYHAHPDDSMLNVLESGMGAREQPLIEIITTAGFERASACYLEHEYAEKVLEGINGKDETYFALIYTLDKEDDWLNPEVWIKANPNLGVSVDIKFIEDRVTAAIGNPSKINDVLTKNLNVWTQAFTRWIPHEAWEKCNFYFEIEKLTGRRCYGALDLSTNQDFSAFTLCFPPEKPGDKYIFVSHIYLPKDRISELESKCRMPLRDWIEEGYITATPGDVVDYDFIEYDVKQAAINYQIMEIAYDPYNATLVTNHLAAEGIMMVEFRQGFLSLSPAAKLFEQKILSKEIDHGGNPVATWMMSCTEVKQDPAGNIKPVKPDRIKSGKRIDVIVTKIMSLARAALNEGDSQYADIEVYAG